MRRFRPERSGSRNIGNDDPFTFSKAVDHKGSEVLYHVPPDLDYIS